jgi:hypothetical protein
VAHRSGTLGHRGLHRRYWLARENLVSYITGLEIEALCRHHRLCAQSPTGRRWRRPVALYQRRQGHLTTSQVSVGQENNLRIRVWGTKKALHWAQENPNYLHILSNEDPEQVYKRGNGYNVAAASAATRLPTGHPEGYFEAFGNIYKNFTDAIRAKIAGVEADEIVTDFPGPVEGARGVYFIHKVIESGQSDTKWLPFDFQV